MIKNINWYILFLLVAILAIGIPSLFVDWLILDDGVMVLVSQKLSFSFKTFNFQEIINLLIEKDLGRFRPAYWLYQWFVYLIAGINPFLQHFVHLIVNSLTVFLIYGIGRNLRLSNKSVFVGCLLFILAPFNFEHWYRLGPVEPRMVLWFCLSLFFLTKILYAILEKRTIKSFYLYISIFFLLLAYLTKETAISMLPFSVLLIAGCRFLKDQVQVDRWRKNTFIYLLANILFTIISLLFVLYIKNQGTYSSNYSLNITDTFNVFMGYTKLLVKSYGLFSLIFIFSFLSNLLKKFSIQKFMQLIFLSGFIFNFIIILPWPYVMGRYLEPSLLFLVIFFQFEAEYFFEFGREKLKQHHIHFNFVGTLLLIAFGFFILKQGPGMVSQIIGNITDTRNTRALFEYIAENVPKNGKVLLNLKKSDATIEVVYETQLHLSIFYKRPDLVVDYFNNDNLVNLKTGDVIFNAFNRSDNYLFLLDKDLFSINNLRVVKIIPNKYVTIRSKLSLSPFSLIEYIEDKRDFRIFQITSL